MYRFYDHLHYILINFRGEYGWSIGLKRRSAAEIAALQGEPLRSVGEDRKEEEEKDAHEELHEDSAEQLLQEHMDEINLDEQDNSEEENESDEGASVKKRKTITMREFYAYQIMVRRDNNSLLNYAPMMHRCYLEGIDRLLRDLMKNDFPFGGKIYAFRRKFQASPSCAPQKD